VGQALEAAEKSFMAVILSPPAPACRQAGQAGAAKNLLSLKRKNKADSLPAGRRARANSALGMTDRAFFSSHLRLSACFGACFGASWQAEAGPTFTPRES
jgi:hypothetical protein